MADSAVRIDDEGLLWSFFCLQINQTANRLSCEIHILCCYVFLIYRYYVLNQRPYFVQYSPNISSRLGSTGGMGRTIRTMFR